MYTKKGWIAIIKVFICPFDSNEQFFSFYFLFFFRMLDLTFSDTMDERIIGNDREGGY